MAALTDLTIAQLGAALAKKEASAVEVADAHLEEARRASRAQRLHHRDAGEGARHGRGLRRAPRQGRGGPPRRHAARHKGSVLHRGRADHGRLAHPRRIRAAVREHGDDQPLEVGRGDGRQDQPRRIRHGLVEHDQPFRRRRESVEAPGRQPQAGARRLVRRLGGGGRGLHGAGQHRHRHRRLDPPAGVVLRHRRSEADLWPLLALGRRRLRQLARPAGAVRPHRRGHRAAAAGDGRPRSEGFDLGAAGACRISSRRRAIRTSRACASASPRNTASTARRRRSRRCGRAAWRC